MSRPEHALTIHQLLGRIVYFHVLFIEPALLPGSPSEPGRRCCNHVATPGQRSVDETLSDSAWMALVEVANTLPTRRWLCPVADGACCATCRIAFAAAEVAAEWARTERRSYRPEEPETLSQACGDAAAARIGKVFADQHSAPCPALDRITVPDTIPSVTELPLTSELLALWVGPTTASRHPVVSWLNHCTGLDDVRRVLETRGTGQ